MPERPKTWDFAPEPGDQHRRIAARHRQAALSASLRDDDAYARNHEALRRAAEILAEACDDFLSRKRRHAAARGDDPEEITLVFDEEREIHVSALSEALLREAVPRVLAKRPR